MLRKIRGYIMTGLAIGWICTTIFLLTAKAENVTGHEMALQFAIWLFASAGYGLASIVYDIFDLTFAKATALHFLISLFITLAASIVAGYIELNEWYMFFANIFPLFAMIYIIITVSIIIISRADARKINRKLNK